MQARRILSMLLALTLLVSVIAPCSNMVHAAEGKTLYGDELEQVTEPVIGESYYLGAEVGGTLKYFAHGTVTDTTPNSLVLTDDVAGAQQITIEDPSAVAESTGEGFQMTYPNPNTSSSTKTLRIHCYGTAGAENTGAAGQATKGRTTFLMEDLDGVKILRKTGNSNVLVIKQVPQTADGETTDVWRMLGVPVEELANEGVYPVMMLKKHQHSYGTETLDAAAGTSSRTCSDCGRTAVVHCQTQEQVKYPVVGKTYYLSANVDGTVKYFKHGTVTDTTPNSLVLTDDVAGAQQITIETPSAVAESTGEGFQMTYPNPNTSSSTKTLRIHCYGTAGAENTGAAAQATKGRTTFLMEDLNGMRILRKTGNNKVLVVKYNETKGAWRMLGVDESELSTEGVYPAMLSVPHEHDYTTGKLQGDKTGHTEACWCGGKGTKTEPHTFGVPTTSGVVTSRSCVVCDYIEKTYDHKVQVEDPDIGQSYYLAANVNGTLKYFVHGAYSQTSPNTLVTTDAVESATPIIIEDPTAVAENDGTGFQLSYTHPTEGKTNRIYCVGTTTKTGTDAYKNRNTFKMDEVNGVPVLRKHGNNTNVLVAKEVLHTDGTTKSWRITGVADTELANEGVYPVMVLQEHAHEKGNTITQITDADHGYGCWCGGIAKAEAHTYGASTHNTATKTTTRTCTVCGYTAAVHGHAQAQVKHPTVGETYYLSANVNGVLKYFTTGTVTDTAPYSLVTTESDSAAVQVTLEDSLNTSEKFEGGFQFTFDNDGTLTRIYCMDVLKDATTAGQTGVMDTGVQTGTAYKNRHSFFVDEVNGVKVLRKYGNNNILVVKYNETKGAWRMLGVDESELGNEGVYPVMLSVAHTEHAYDDTWTFDKEAGTQSHVCVACGGFPTGTLYGTDIKATQVTEPVTDGTGTYYLGANVEGVLKFFTTGTVTNTAPYSLVTTERDSVAVQVTLEDSLNTSEKFEGGFQFTFDNNGTLTRIYCMDVLKDATTAGQTGVMDTGVQTGTAYKNRHSFFVDEVNGVKVLRKYGNDNILVVKLLDSTGTYRMLGVPEAELANEGVYPVMILDLHNHAFGEEIYSEESGHYHLCDCESKSDVISHSFGDWTLDRENQKQTATCKVCDYTLTTVSPYLDTVDSEEELINGLADTVLNEDTGAYTVSGGKDYYLIAEIGDDFYYFRNADKTAGGNSETVTSTSGYSLYVTNDPNNENILKTNVTPGNTEDTYVIRFVTTKDMAVYVNDEGTNDVIDTGLTAFLGVSSNATYKARSEFMWDEENGCLYQLEGSTKYVLVMKQMEASYASGTETGTEWRMIAVPMAEATPEQGNYPVMLVQHVHNLHKQFLSENGTYYRDCGCGYHATVETGIVLGESVGMNFNVKLEEGETVTATVAGSETAVQLNEKSGNTYTAFVSLAAAQMTDEVKISVGGDLLDEAFTVRAFADAILADENYNQYAKDLMNHMLVYGSAAQNYFDHNTENLAGAGIDVSVDVPEEVLGVAVQSDLEGVKFYGASVVHEGRTAVRFYFTADSVDGLTFTVDGNVYEPEKKDDKYYIEVGDINPQNLDQEMTAVVSNGEQNLAVQYSPLIYIIRTYNRADASTQLKDLVKALYGYHKATKTYIANMYLGNDFALKSQTVTSLYEGVDQYASTYVAAGEGEVKAYAITIKADANVELKVSAGTWSASSTAENPGETKTVVKHFRDMKSAGSNVLAMINGGFFDLNSGKTMKPYGMQIVDGVVKQAPAAGSYSDNWFGMTKDGKYVISNAEGYQSTYIDNVQQGVGGGKLLVVNGQVQDLTSDRDYRTAVGVNTKGDLVLVAVENATYNDVCQIFVDLNMDIVTVLNLDGGGSTAMYVPGAFYPKALILGEDGLLPREVADAVGVVVKP